MGMTEGMNIGDFFSQSNRHLNHQFNHHLHHHTRACIVCKLASACISLHHLLIVALFHVRIVWVSLAAPSPSPSPSQSPITIIAMPGSLMDALDGELGGMGLWGCEPAQIKLHHVQFVVRPLSVWQRAREQWTKDKMLQSCFLFKIL